MAAAAAAVATTTEEKTTWTTWEELLLACAVKRHGMKDWDSVAMELQSRWRTASPALLTPQICKTKFLDLKSRFMAEDDHDDDDKRQNDLNDGDIDSIPWLEELRKLRVAELKQEVHRYDLSIQSLQMEVKRLEDDRETSLKAEEDGGGEGKLDLEEVKGERSEKNDEFSPAEVVAVEPVPGTDSDRSFNESNSSENRVKEEESTEPERVEAREVKPDTDSGSDLKPFAENSCNDSSDTIAKHEAASKPSQEKSRGGGESAELRDSAAESKDGTKESSDVQSSASLTTKKRRRGEVSGGGDEPVMVSPAITTKRESSVKSEPLVAFLDIIRSHKHGSLFERRLESQKTEKYKKLIRQHVDLDTVKKRIENGSYFPCASKFYLDLLLIFNNAIVFYPRSSTESKAAHQLRTLVSEELKQKQTHNSDPSPESTSNPIKPKSELQRSDSLLAKHKLSAPIVMCRKRSSISAKSSSLKMEEKQAEAKPIVNSKQPVKSSTSLNEEGSSIKLKIKEKPVTGARSMRRGSQGRTNSNTHSKNQNAECSSLLTSSDNKGEAQKAEKKKIDVIAPAKKRGAADFLKRIKKGSPGKGTPLDKLKSSSSDLSGGRRDQTKKKLMDEQKDVGMRRNGGKMVEDSSPSKRNVGRPPKKGKETVPVKRGRESGGGGADSVSNRPKKRTRR